eukprot:TRINITY_DN4181_c0_g2_i2.p2 TRINITY_DN4181_c0_g2~~TRINITY_DN4181_c0_g2_i2.p2  ORF type:complete len:114 (+),score=10.24 TRINITY_DN4181_c0_g2_i2:389-730(+)
MPLCNSCHLEVSVFQALSLSPQKNHLHKWFHLEKFLFPCRGVDYLSNLLHSMSHLKLRKFLSLIHISEPTRPLYISYAVFCLKKKKKQQNIPPSLQLQQPSLIVTHVLTSTFH